MWGQEWSQSEDRSALGSGTDARLLAAVTELAEAIAEASRRAPVDLTLVSIAEAARRLDRSTAWVRKQIDAGLIHEVQVADGDPFVSLASLVEFVNRGPERPDPPPRRASRR